ICRSRPACRVTISCRSSRRRCRPRWIGLRRRVASPNPTKWRVRRRAGGSTSKPHISEESAMFRLTSLAAAALLGSAALAMAQQPSYSPANPDRYSAQQTTTNSTMPQRQTYSNWRQTMTPSRETRMPTRQTMNANQFSTESDARAQCGSDTIVWVNTKSHVYHFPASREFGQTKRGAFMCQADVDRAGTFRAAKNELRMQGSTQRSLGAGSGPSMNRLGAGAGRY